MKYAFLFLLSLNLYAQDISHVALLIDSTLTKNSNSVVREELITVDVTNSSQLIRKVSRTITVFNKNGNDEVAPYLYYDDQTDVKNLAFFIYDHLGKEIEHYKKRDFKDVSVSDGFSLHTDNRMLYAEHIPKSYPYTAKFISEIKTNTTAFLPRWYPISQYASSTEKSVYKIVFDPENKPTIRKSNLEPYNIKIEEDVSEITFTATMLPSILYESHAPQFSSFAPHIMLALKTFSLKGVMGNGATWSDFGSWMDNQLLKGTGELPLKTISEINSLVTEKMTDIKKARIVYQYLQDKVRYINVSIGIGGWKPMLASEVDKLSYGDCKALTNYTKALLKSVGVPSYYTVLHSSSNEQDITKDFVAMQGNHVMLAIPNGEDLVWLECTSQDIPFGHVPNSNDDRDVLIVTEDGGKIVHTTRYDSSDNLQESQAEIVILDTGEFQATYKRRSQGLQYDNVYWLDIEDKAEQHKYYKGKWNYINGIELTDLVLDNNRIDVVFTEMLKASSANFTSFVGEDLLLTLNVFNQLSYVPPRIIERKNKVEIRIGFTDKDDYSIFIPEGYSVESLSEKKEISSLFGTYVSEVTQEEQGVLKYERTLIMNKGVYPAENYEGYRSFLKKITKYDKTKVLLKRN